MTDADDRIVVEMSVDELSAVYVLVGLVDSAHSDIDLRELYDNLDSMVDDLYPGYDYVNEPLVDDESIILLKD